MEIIKKEDLMIRNDFVSNSSSSSFIVATKLKEDDFIKHVVCAFGGTKLEDYAEDAIYPDLNKRHLINYLQYTMLFINTFFKFTKKVLERKYLLYHHTLTHFSVLNRNIKKIFKNDKLDWDEFNKNITVSYPYKDEKENEPKISVNPPYNTFCIPTARITKETIQFTKWFLEHCSDISQITQTYDYHTKTPDDKLQEVFGPYIDKWCVFSKKEILQNIEKIERKLNDGYNLYYITVGYSGNGQDYDYYLWYDVDNTKSISDTLKDYNIEIVNINLE